MNKTEIIARLYKEGKITEEEMKVLSEDSINVNQIVFGPIKQYPFAPRHPEYPYDPLNPWRVTC